MISIYIINHNHEDTQKYHSMRLDADPLSENSSPAWRNIFHALLGKELDFENDYLRNQLLTESTFPLIIQPQSRRDGPLFSIAKASKSHNCKTIQNWTLEIIILPKHITLVDEVDILIKKFQTNII